MALKVKIEKAKTEGKVMVFFFHFVLLLIVFGLLLIGLLLLGGLPISRTYLLDYGQFSPFSVVVPLIIALTTTISHKTSLLRISPANNVNIDKLQEFLFKIGYKVTEEKPGLIKFQKAKLTSRILWLNIDKPSIEVKQDEVLMLVDKYTEVRLTPLLTYGKQYELNPE